MSTSLLYHSFGIQGPYHYVSTQYENGATIFNIAHNPRMKCPECKSRKVIKKGTQERQFLGVPIGTKKTVIRLLHQRIQCTICHVIKSLPLKFIPRPKVRYTRAFERYVMSLSIEKMTISSIAKLCNVGWDCIKAIQKRALKRRYQHPNYKNVTHIGIDEIYCGAKSGFMTVVIDMKTSAVIYTEKGKKAASLDGFWKIKNRCKQAIVAVATDMGQAYISSVKKHAPQASLVIDRFHVVKRFNERLSEFRRKIQNEMETQDEVQFLKNTRWLLLSNPDKLSEKGKNKLMQALDANQPLATVYYFKEKLRMLWSQPSKEQGEIWLDDWVQQAKDSGIELLESFAKTLIKHKQGILAYYDEKMTSGKVEGVNNRTKTLSKIAYGYRDWEFFELKIKASHEGRYAFSG